MDETRFDESVKGLAGAADRRDALRSLGAAGLALLTALGLRSGDAAGTKRRRGGGAGGKGGGRNDKDRSRQGNHPDRPGTPAAGADETPEGAGGLAAERKRKKRGPTGPAGPTGPTAGGTGPTGPTGPNFSSTIVQGDTSDPLATTQGDLKASSACCDTGKLLGGGYSVQATSEQAFNVLVEVAFPAGDCYIAQIKRTSSTGSVAGAKVRAFAICRP